jgi:hypothetical protein
MRSVGGAVALLVICVIGWAVRSGGGGTSDKFLWQSKAFVAQADVYNEHREYFDWLVETAHNDVFSDSYSAGFGRRARATMNVDKYEEDIIDRMIDLAKSNDRHEIAESIERLVDPDAAARQKAEKDAKKKSSKKK